MLIQVMATPYLVEAAAGAGRRSAATAALAVFDQWASSTASPSRRALSARGSADAERGFRTALRHRCLFVVGRRAGRHPRQHLLGRRVVHRDCLSAGGGDQRSV
ncbi:hypothetical protein ACQP26_12445 [Micromonospora sp. CA-248089]|uniref:hypothetical protein n=1 Tax=Micromonospora sp. CA-248089 TaxID=3239960 RepID=UPI003D94885A